MERGRVQVLIRAVPPLAASLLEQSSSATDHFMRRGPEFDMESGYPSQNVLPQTDAAAVERR